MADTTIEVRIGEAKAVTKAALEKIGWDAESAEIQAEIMTFAETCGNNQGLVKMFQPALMAPAPGAAKPTLEKQSSNTAVVNGNQCPGMLALATAVDHAVQKSAGGAAVVGVYNTSTSSGQLAYYARRAALSGRIVVIMANSPEFVGARPGAKATFGTNPICFATPVDGCEPLIFDMATAAVALFGVLTAKAQGLPLPEHSAYDASGNWTTDVADIHVGGGDGAIATFGGHKGAGLALMVELLCGALTGAAVLGDEATKKDAKNWGHTVIAIDPLAMVEGYAERAAKIIAAVAASHPDGVRMPGEGAARVAAERTARGSIPVPSKIWEVIVETAASGLPSAPRSRL